MYNHFIFVGVALSKFERMEHSFLDFTKSIKTDPVNCETFALLDIILCLINEFY